MPTCEMTKMYSLPVRAHYYERPVDSTMRVTAYKYMMPGLKRNLRRKCKSTLI